MQILKEIQVVITVLQTCPEEFEDRIIFMSQLNDIDWTKRGDYNDCFSNSEQVKDFAKRCPLGHWSFLAPGEAEKWYGTERTSTNLKDNGIPLQMPWWPISKTADIRASSALDRVYGTIARKDVVSHCSIHQCMSGAQYLRSSRGLV